MIVDGVQVFIMYTEVLVGSRYFFFFNVIVVSCSFLCDIEGVVRFDFYVVLCLFFWDFIVMQIDQREYKQNYGRKGVELKFRR